ncbi:hypothetical protein SALBM311S_03087 [Streptomyces alboniger]
MVAPVADDAGRVLVIVDVVEDGAEDDGDGTSEVDDFDGVGVSADAFGVAHIDRDNAGPVVVLQQCAAVDQRLGVDVDVDDLGLGSVPLRDLVDVVRRRQAAAQVDELPNAGGLRDLPDRPRRGRRGWRAKAMATEPGRSRLNTSPISRSTA